jgi:FtsH-binding integral membrane protein
MLKDYTINFSFLTCSLIFILMSIISMISKDYSQLSAWGICALVFFILTLASIKKNVKLDVSRSIKSNVNKISKS